MISNFALELQNRREGAGLSRGALSRETGICVPNIRGWEHKRHSPRIDHAIRVLQAVGARLAVRWSDSAEDCETMTPLASAQDLAETLREVREVAGLSQHEAASAAGFKREQWNRWENSSSRPTFAAASRALESLGACLEILPAWPRA